MFSHARNKMINKMIDTLASNTKEPDVNIKRRKAFYFLNTGEVDHEGKSTIFG
jgi:hypothetical protein